MSETPKFSTDLEVSSPRHPNALASVNIVSSASFALPGLSVSVDRFGVGFDVALNLENINFDGPDLGLFKITPVYRPVTGVAAEINIPPVGGSGYLRVTPRDLRGTFSANLGVISVNALAVMERRDRFSFLVLMAAEFHPPLQLSFGFTLAGIGGIVGINRRADDNALTEAMRNGDLSQLLFPRDPIGEAPRLLDVANRCFPSCEGGVLVGPMVKVGWGTPTMLSATLAIIISSANSKAILLGRIALTLPAEAAPLIYLQALVKGDIDQWGVRIDATLNNSRILFMPVDGDISLRMITGPDEPLFAFSAGGFHPGFAPPHGMGAMRRLSIDLSPNPLMMLRAEAYLAVTTSSIQFGGRIEIQIGVEGFRIHGQIRFDAFINYDPFWFEVPFNASVSVECADFDIASIRLNGTIGGPTKWFLTGHAAIELLFFDVDIDIPRIEWGSAEASRIVGRDPVAVLRKAIDEADNWVAVTRDVSRIARLRNGPGDAFVCHPLSSIAFRQNDVPLDTEITLIDGVSLESPVTLRLGSKEERKRFLLEKFIPHRFFKLDGNERLSQSGFRDLPGGLDFSPQGVIFGNGSLCGNDYEIKVLEADEPLPFVLVRPDYEGVSIGPMLRQAVRVKPPFEPRDPGVLIKNSALGLTDAAGRILAEVPQWELLQ